MIDNIVDLVTLHEGKERKVYKCTSGKLTIGVGRNLEDLGLSNKEIDFLLRNDLTRVQLELMENVPCYPSLSEPRQAVLMDMCFNLGINRFMKFQRMLTALEIGDYEESANEMLDSKWARQVGIRSARLAEMMRSNSWPLF